MTDRLFRADGVVDLISIRMYGLFGMDYFSTFNVADLFVTVCGLLFLAVHALSNSKNKKAEHQKRQ